MLPKHRRGPWSSAEDQFLLELVRTQGASNWVRISQLIQSRSPKQCRERYHQNLKSSLNLEPISAEEGVLIERMVAEIGKRWAEIARRLHGRSDNAVKNWWNGGMNRRKRRDNRRTEMGPQHHHHHHSHTMRPIQQAGPPLHNLQVPHPAYEPMFAPPQYRYEQIQPAGPIHPPPQVYPPPPRQIQPSRHAVDHPLPSPSASSYVSRTDSSEGAPPSLVSDASYSSYSQSPSTQYSAHDPPTPLDHRDQYTRPSIPPFSHSVQQFDPYAPRDPNVTVLSSQPAKEYYHHPHPAQAEQWRERRPASSTPVARPSQPQLALPSFQTLTATGQRLNEPSSPPKDKRMNVNALIH